MDDKLIISADKPIVDPKDDRFDYAPFARHLAESIVKMGSAEGFTVAIYGPWGSGKTTTLNFVSYALRQGTEAEQPIIVSFNPWLFSGRNDLIKQFFNQLIVAIGKKEGIQNSVREGLSDFAEVIAEIPLPYTGMAKVLAKIIRPKPKNINQLKKNVEEALRKQEKKIIVVIDDIDRLTSEEIRQLFGVIKAVANFPNTIYLIALDKKVAIQALKTEQGTSGEEYLDKIVQVPFELPIPGRSALRTLLTEKLDSMLAGTPAELFDQAYWGNIYLEGIDHFISTPRDVVRLTNTLFITYPSLRKEVNAVDFIAIETIRVFLPGVYEIIRNNRDEFSGHVFSNTVSTGYDDKRLDRWKSFHDSWLDKVHEEYREPIKRLLSRLFPKCEASWGGSQYGSDFLSEWQKNRRICSPEVFPIYFRFAVPQGDISNSEMKAILEITGNAQAFGAKIEELASQKRPDGTTRFKAFIQRLGDYTKSDIPLGSINPMIDVFFNFGDYLLKQEDEQRGPADISTSLETYWILAQLLDRLDQKNRYNVLRGAISKGNAVSMIVYIITLLGKAHGKYGEKEWSDDDKLISLEELEELEKIALEKIRTTAHSDSLEHYPPLMRRPLLTNTLHRWKDWGDEIEVKGWIEKIIVEDEGLVQFIMVFFHKTYIQPLSDVIGKVQNRLDPKWIEPFIDPSIIVDRARILVTEKEIIEDERVALEQFITEYDIRKAGKDPERELRLRT